MKKSGRKAPKTSAYVVREHASAYKSVGKITHHDRLSPAGKRLPSADVELIRKVVDRAVKEYGGALKKLADR
ncbi:MAG: hypothetical protein ACYC56_14405 [Candidatus Aquicultor sp.]